MDAQIWKAVLNLFISNSPVQRWLKKHQQKAEGKRWDTVFILNSNQYNASNMTADFLQINS